MRLTIPSLLAVVAALAVLPSAAAQDDGCLESNPCVFDVGVDEDGLFDPSIVNMTSGDWFTLSVSNLEERAHTLSFNGITLHVEGYGDAESAPFQAPAAGTYKLTDQPTGDQLDIHVLAGDVVEAEDGASSGAGKGGIPGPSAAVVALGLVALALLARRSA